VKTDHIAIFRYPENTSCVKEFVIMTLNSEQSICLSKGIIKNQDVSDPMISKITKNSYDHQKSNYRIELKVVLFYIPNMLIIHQARTL
jgi:hypothetical protein